MSPLKNIDDCFERGLLRKVEPSRTKSERSLLQARDWLYEAEKNLEAEAYRSALSTAYLAVFHSARAVLFRDGVREKSHYCIGLYLQRYVEENALEAEWPMLFDRIRSVRHAISTLFRLNLRQKKCKLAMPDMIEIWATEGSSNELPGYSCTAS